MLRLRLAFLLLEIKVCGAPVKYVFNIFWQSTIRNLPHLICMVNGSCSWPEPLFYFIIHYRGPVHTVPSWWYSASGMLNVWWTPPLFLGVDCHWKITQNQWVPRLVRPPWLVDRLWFAYPHSLDALLDSNWILGIAACFRYLAQVRAMPAGAEQCFALLPVNASLSWIFPIL